ncbi:MAG: GNAT family N-acetyltransferase [Anaerolineae bacterium]
MKLHIRDFDGSDQDYQTYNDIFNACWPELKRSIESMKYDDQTRNRDNFHRQVVIDMDNEPIGYGIFKEKWWAKDKGEYSTNFFVKPTAPVPFEEVAITFNHFMLQCLATRNAKKLTIIMSEDRVNLVEFYKAAGYKLVQREPVSELQIADFDFERFANAEKKIEAKGFKIYTLGELKDRFENWQRLDYELLEPVIQDIPSDTERAEFPFDEFIKEYDMPTFMFDSNFYALEVESQKWVGMSSLNKNSGDPNSLKVGLTGVHKAYRGNGLATALKVKTIEFARDYGAKSIKTENDENNSMYDLNMLLGFRPKPAFVTYELTL